VDKNTEIIK